MAFRRFSSWRFLSAASSTGSPDAIRTGRHRFKLTFTQVPCVLFVLRLLPFPILLKGSLRPPLAPILAHVIDNNDIVVHLCPFRFRRKGYTPALPVQRQNCRPSWNFLRTGWSSMPYGVHERLRSHRGVDLTGKPQIWLSPVTNIK